MAATTKVRAWITEERCYQDSRGSRGEGRGGILCQLGLPGAQEGPQGPGLCLCQVAGELTEGRPDHHHPLHYFLKTYIWLFQVLAVAPQLFGCPSSRGAWAY